VLSRIPIDLGKLDPEDIDREILRAAIIADLDAINLYKQMAATATDEKIQAVLLDVAREKKPTSANFRPCFYRLMRNRPKNWPTVKKSMEEIIEE